MGYIKLSFFKRLKKNVSWCRLSDRHFANLVLVLFVLNYGFSWSHHVLPVILVTATATSMTLCKHFSPAQASKRFILSVFSLIPKYFHYYCCFFISYTSSYKRWKPLYESINKQNIRKLGMRSRTVLTGEWSLQFILGYLNSIFAFTFTLQHKVISFIITIRSQQTLALRNQFDLLRKFITFAAVVQN